MLSPAVPPGRPTPILISWPMVGIIVAIAAQPVTFMSCRRRLVTAMAGPVVVVLVSFCVVCCN